MAKSRALINVLNAVNKEELSVERQFLLPDSDEVWTDIEGYPNYLISTKGRVFGKTYNKILKPYYNQGGYARISLMCNHKEKQFSIHRLVAEAFIPNLDNLPEVNHKDENPKNNEVSNLEWCTGKYNCNYGTRNEKLKNLQLKVWKERKRGKE